MCVPKEEREEHEEECKATMTCPHCKYSAPRFIYKDHEENCNFKPKKSPYCDEMIKYEDWDNHLETYGNKTY